MISRQKMPLNQTKEEGEKLSESEDLEGNEKKRTEKSKERTTTTTTTSKSNTFDLTKTDNTPTGLIDILDEPDVAVWSKGIANKTNTPADKVQEASHIKSITTHIDYREGEREQKQSYLQQTVDPANKEDVAKAIGLGTSLTDEAATFVKGSKKKKLPPKNKEDLS
jgi:hypothetical protein